jgi:hypothetical protein
VPPPLDLRESLSRPGARALLPHPGSRAPCPFPTKLLHPAALPFLLSVGSEPSLACIASASVGSVLAELLTGLALDRVHQLHRDLVVCLACGVLPRPKLLRLQFGPAQRPGVQRT